MSKEKGMVSCRRMHAQHSELPWNMSEMCVTVASLDHPFPPFFALVCFCGEKRAVEGVGCLPDFTAHVVADLLDNGRRGSHGSHDHTLLSTIQEIEVESRRALAIGLACQNILGDVHHSVGQQQVHALGGGLDGQVGHFADLFHKVISQVGDDIGDHGDSFVTLDVIHHGIGQVLLEVDLGLFELLADLFLDVGAGVLLEEVEKDRSQGFHAWFLLLLVLVWREGECV